MLLQLSPDLYVSDFARTRKMSAIYMQFFRKSLSANSLRIHEVCEIDSAEDIAAASFEACAILMLGL